MASRLQGLAREVGEQGSWGRTRLPPSRDILPGVFGKRPSAGRKWGLREQPLGHIIPFREGRPDPRFGACSFPPQPAFGDLRAMWLP